MYSGTQVGFSLDVDGRRKYEAVSNRNISESSLLCLMEQDQEAQQRSALLIRSVEVPSDAGRSLDVSVNAGLISLWTRLLYMITRVKPITLSDSRADIMKSHVDFRR